MPFRKVFMQLVGLDYQDERIKTSDNELVNALLEVREVKEANLFNGSVDIVIQSALLLRDWEHEKIRQKIDGVIEAHFSKETPSGLPQAEL